MANQNNKSTEINMTNSLLAIIAYAVSVAVRLLLVQKIQSDKNLAGYSSWAEELNRISALTKIVEKLL